MGLHNENVLDKKRGEILLGRRWNQQTFSLDDYGPCPKCLEWLMLSVIDRYQSVCPLNSKSNQTTKENLLLQSSVLAGRIADVTNTTLKSKVFPIMRIDKIGKIAKHDGLIVTLANQ